MKTLSRNDVSVKIRGTAAVRPDDPVLRALRGARDLVRDGWTQGREHRVKTVGPKGSFQMHYDMYCVIGAVEHTTEGLDKSVEEEVYGLIKDEISPKMRRFARLRIALWNDARTRTHIEVVQMFDRVIEKRKRGNGRA